MEEKMKRFIFKLVTFVEILSIVSANSMATVVYASDQIADAKTSQDCFCTKYRIFKRY